jgi:hypothetical protein
MKRIVQLAIVGALSVVASAKARANVPYLGGRIMPTVRIVPIWFGADSNPSAADALLADLVDYVKGAKNPAGKQSLFAQYGVTGAQKVFLSLIDPIQSDHNPRVLDDTEVRNIIHAVQQTNSNFYGPDKVFLLLPGTGYSTSVGGICGYHAAEADGRHYAVVPSDCPTRLETISRQVMSVATSANGDGWEGLLGACSATHNFGAGPIGLPFDNHVGACPPIPGPNATRFDDKMGEVVQVLVSNTNGGLFHTIRYPNAWTPFGDVKAVVGSAPGFITDVDAQATFGVFNHVVVRGTGSKLWHTLRTDSGWTPWIDVNAATGAGGTTFAKVGLANVDGDLHVCATTSGGGVLHAIRYASGSWTGFGDVLGQTGAPPGTVVDVDCAGVGSEMHIVMATNGGGVFHAIRTAAGWTGLGDVEGAAGSIPAVTLVSAALFASDLHVTVRVTGATQYHTLRHNAGTWTPFATPPNNNSVQEHSSAGTADFLHLVSVENGVVKHRVRDALSNWSAVGNVYGQAGNAPGQANGLSAASSLAY